MRKAAASLALFGAVAATIFFLLPADTARPQGGAPRTWVSGVGDDANPCSRTAPCKTFAGAISKTAENGIINCLDPGGFGAVTITKSITIDCHEIYASTLVSGTNAIVINFDAFAVDDTARSVHLRNINFAGLNTGLDAIKIIGAATNSKVYIDDCDVENFATNGIEDTRTGGGELNISNTSIRNVIGASSAGVRISNGGTTNKIKASLTGVHVENSAYGLLTKYGAQAAVTNSLFSGNSNAGVEAENDSVVNLDHVVSTENLYGVREVSPAEARMADSDITFNNQGLAGTVTSFGTNRIWGNNTAGSAPTAAGGASSALGQQ
jgi:hypothetical protein